RTERLEEFVAVISNDVVEGVVPEREDVERQFFAIVLLVDEIVQQGQHAVDMIVVEMADHQHTNRQGSVRASRLFEFGESGTQAAVINACWTTINDDQFRRVRLSVVK